MKAKIVGTNIEVKRTNLSEEECAFIQHWMNAKKLTSDLPILAKL